jgi:hypothetical protein
LKGCTIFKTDGLRKQEIKKVIEFFKVTKQQNCRFKDSTYRFSGGYTPSAVTGRQLIDFFANLSEAHEDAYATLWAGRNGQGS